LLTCALKYDTPKAGAVEELTGFETLTDALVAAPPPDTVAVFVTLPDRSAATVTGIAMANVPTALVE
jgi:hypothetical protein